MAPHTDDRRRAGARARGGGAACRLERPCQARHRSPGVPRALLVRRRAGPGPAGRAHALARRAARACRAWARSEEHTSELQSLAYLVCRLLLEKKKKARVS